MPADHLSLRTHETGWVAEGLWQPDFESHTRDDDPVN